MIKNHICQFALLLMLICLSAPLWAQMPGGSPVQVSSETQIVNGKKYYVHVVQKGQTVYAIAQAYGVKAYDAVVKKDIHFLSVGDTVLLPCKGQTLPTPQQPASKSSQKTTPSAPSTPVETIQPAVLKPRVSQQEVVVSLMMPLYLDKLSEVSTTKFDVEQRGKKSYQQFEFIQFYEGVQLGLERLEQQGYSVRLNVVDVSNNQASAVEQVWESHNVGHSDFVIALLTKDAFAKAAQLAQRDHVFIINPMANRPEIVTGNPYVVKCMPSISGRVATFIKMLQLNMPSAQVFLIHSGAPNEMPYLNELVAQLSQQGKIKYTQIDWTKSGSKLLPMLKSSPSCVLVSLYDRDKGKNRIFANTLLNQLSSLKNHDGLALMTFEDWTMLFNDADFVKLQHANYHTFMTGWDYGNTVHADFLKAFRERYKTEPMSQYAGMGNDLIIYFVTGVGRKGSDFWKNPNLVIPDGVLYPLSFSQKSLGDGFENKSALLYRMQDFRFVDVRKAQ